MRTTTLACCIGLALTAGHASAQSVTWDYDKEADFARYTTYVWVRGTPVPDEMNHKRVIAAVDSQLVLRGLRPAPAGSDPDLLIAYHANFSRDVQINAYVSDWGPRRLGGMRTGTARAEELLTGTLIVEMWDVRAESVVWRGIATREIDVKASPDKREKNINKAAEKLFKHYPPSR